MSDAPGSADRNDTAWPERLRAERERRGLDRRQVAEDLHVDTWIIDALEAGQFASLGAPVYARGYLRQYAVLLELDAAQLVSSFEHQGAPPPELVPLTPTRMPRPAGVPMMRLGALVVAGIVAGTAWWALSERDEGISAPAPRTPTSGAAAPVEADAPAVDEPAIAAPALADAAAAESTSTAAAPRIADPAPGDKPVRLRLSFSADCWVEVYEADGERVFFDLGRANSVRSVTASAPLQVLLGYADGVRLELDGQPVTLPAQTRGGFPLRFTVDADGRAR